MKKTLAILVAMLFVVVAVGAAFAAETTFDGQYRVRAWTNWNFEKKPNHLDSERGRYDGYFDQRFRLTITHTRSEFLKAVIQIDLVEDTWGQQRNFRINNNTDGEFVNAAYIDFTLPKVGTFRVGKQPVVFGAGLAFSDSSGNLDGIKWANKWGPVGVSAMYFKWSDKVYEGGASEYYNRDSDIWALSVMYTPNENHAIELFGGYDNARTGFPVSHGLGSHLGTAGLPTNLDSAHANVGFVGIGYTGEIADMITLKGEFSYLFGRADWTNWPVQWSEVQWLSGYNLYLDAAYHNDLLTVGLAFVLGSGQTTSRFNTRPRHFNINFITADEFVFGNIIASGNGGLNDDFGGGLGFCDDVENLTALKLYFEITPLCCDGKLTLNAAVIRAWWTEPVGWQTFYVHPVTSYAGLGSYASWNGSSTDLGWEIDLGMRYEIMEGLSYSIAAGVLFTGDSFDYRGVGNTHQEWGPIWTVNNTLMYEF